MKNGVILYQSKYGATKQYAQWLSDATGWPMLESRKATLQDVQDCQQLVLMGGVYASGIAGLHFLKKHIDALGGKQICVFAVGASPYDEKAIRQCAQHNLKGPLSRLALFYGQGAWDPKGMTFGDRTLCKLLQKAVAKQDPSTFEPWMTALLQAGDSQCSWLDRNYLQPLLDALNVDAGD